MKRTLGERAQNKLWQIHSVFVYYALYCIRFAFPIKQDKFFCISMMGKNFGCNVKSLSDYVRRRMPETSTIIWAKERTLDIDTSPYQSVKLYGFKYVYHLFTSKYIISNSRMITPLMPRKRSGQTYLQTWHGTALKRIEAGMPHYSRKYKRESIHDSRMIDLFISNSAFMTHIYKSDFWYDGEVFETGTPRNDIFFKNNIEQTQCIKKLFNIENKKIALYAPTFRQEGDVNIHDINVGQLIFTLKEKTNEDWVLMIRFHPNIQAQIPREDYQRLYPNAINASDFPDMNELLCACDLLISDYSSSIFDFVYTRKPCLIYATDIAQYDRGFYMDIYKLPFPIATNNEELHKIIESFDYKQYLSNVELFQKNIGAVEDGNACERVIGLLKQ